ncbi:MAG: hypothetical protein ABUL66_01840, partial [Verrucomicrobiota bacterium]
GFWWSLLILIGLLMFSPTSTKAFALLGPVQPWMQASNNVIEIGDIGGPMAIGDGYRWNVPVVTYGFDQSFLDYFGTNGVAAVEGAIKIINDLPPASQIVLTNYPFDSRQVNYAAENQQLLDLKSQTLSLLLEHLGLAQPTRYVWVLKYWDPNFIPYGQNLDEFSWPAGTVPDYIDERNFDPQTLAGSAYVNSMFYYAYVSILLDFSQYVIITAADPLAATYNAVADFGIGPGTFYTGLTYDDAGGLAYLLSTNTINYETLLSDVAGAATNSNSFVNGAWRPGVDKITFVPQPVDLQSGAFLSTTNHFTDHYMINGALKQQQMQRVISQPDFLFSAGDTSSNSPVISFYTRAGTTGWLNNAAANGNTNGEGPGIIGPPVQIVFNKLGRTIYSDDYSSEDQALDYSTFWGSFSASTNTPILYPISQKSTNQTTVRVWLMFDGNNKKCFAWNPNGLSGTQFTVQTSTNLENWTTLFTITNNGSICNFLNEKPSSISRFYRLIP